MTTIAGSREALSPAHDQRLLREQIWDVRREVFTRRSKRAGQAHQRALKVEDLAFGRGVHEPAPTPRAWRLRIPFLATFQHMEIDQAQISTPAMLPRMLGAVAKPPARGRCFGAGRSLSSAAFNSLRSRASARTATIPRQESIRVFRDCSRLFSALVRKQQNSD